MPSLWTNCLQALKDLVIIPAHYIIYFCKEVNMKFTKMNGLGNDYIFINNDIEKVIDPENLSCVLTDRHRSIGGDGIVLIEKLKEDKFYMRIFNTDGSEGEMCGNALRCLGKYVYEKNMTDSTNIFVETKSGLKEINLTVEDSQIVDIKTQIGKANLLKFDNEYVHWLLVNDYYVQVFCVTVGNPHCLFFVDNYYDDLMKIAHLISENIKIFPNRINVEVVNDNFQKGINVNVFERGSGITLACGTGAAATFYILNYLGFIDGFANISLPGGNLQCEFSTTGEIIIDGPAEINFEGEI